MIKKIFKIVIAVLILFILLAGYFAYFGLTTTKFNSIIKDQVKKQSADLDIDIKKVKLHLDIKNLSIKIKTKNPKLILNNSKDIEINEISSNISISSYFQNKFAIKNLLISSKINEISSNLKILESDTVNIVEYVESSSITDKKKYNFLELLFDNEK